MLPSIAIAGSTGHLGQHIVSAVVSTQFAPRFSRVVLLSRTDPKKANLQNQVPLSSAVIYESEPSTATSTEEAATTRLSAGRTPVVHRQYNVNNLVEVLQDVTVLVDAIGSEEGTDEFKDRLIRAAAHTPINLYIPSEFGVDHYIHDFSHPMWDVKKAHFSLARSVLAPQKVNICRVFCGLFLEDSIGPWFGFDTRNGVYESIGSAEKGISFTALEDLGKTVAQLSGGDPTTTVPEVLHIGGDTRSMRQIASCMTTSGGGKIEIREQRDVAAYRDRVVHAASSDPAACIRFLMGEGKINHSSKGMGNDNNIVNPNQTLWKWKTMTALANDTGGRPWKDMEWSLT